MCRLYFLLLLVFFLAAPGISEARWKLVADMPILAQLVETGDDEHQIYYAIDSQNRRCLIYVCHGKALPDGNLAVKVDGKFYNDYVSAVESSILQHSLKGELKGLSFEAIYLFCCHVGMGQMKEWSPTFKCPFLHTLDYKKPVAVKKRFSKAEQGKVIGLELYTDEERTLRVVNNSGREIYGIYVRTSPYTDWGYDTDWGQNILTNNQVLPNGRSMTLHLRYDARYFDIKVYFRGRDSFVYWNNIDTEKTEVMTIVPNGNNMRANWN